jgi:hypothetical protein
MSESRGQRVGGAAKREAGPRARSGGPDPGTKWMMDGEVEISRLRQQILALADADCVRPGDGQALLTVLDGALQAIAAGDLPAARLGIEQFIAAAQGLIEAGVLAGREGRPSIEAAYLLLAALCGSAGLLHQGEDDDL